jgi:hypothetical protein
VADFDDPDRQLTNGYAVAVGSTRQTSPWKCSITIPVMIDGVASNASIIVCTAPSLSSVKNADFQ